MPDEKLEVTETKPAEKPFKLRFINRFQKKLVEFAELPTAVTKIEFLSKYEQFGNDFKTVYPDYYKYLVVSIEREKLLHWVAERTTEMKNIMFGAVQVDRAFQSKYKRMYRLNRRLAKRLRYRLRPNYFDNYLINDWINTYNACGEPVLNDLIARQIDLIIIRQVKRLKLYQFSTPMDDLLQEIRVACLTALKKFDVSKGKPGREAFNYFSHICKKAGFMITLRHSDRKKQETPDSDMVTDTLGTMAYDRDDPFADMSANDRLGSFYEYFHAMFERKERMQLLLQILVYYVLNVSFFTFKKNDFVKFACSYGFTPAFVNKFLNIMKSNRDKFEKDIDLGF